MNFLRGRSGEPTTLKMTAMIDIVFQLLIFFLVATKFRVPEGELDAYLPEEGAPIQITKRDVPVDEIRVTLRVSAAAGRGKGLPPNPTVQPSVLLDGKRFGEGGASTGSMKWLAKQLNKLAEDDKVRDEVPVIIEAESRLAYQWVIQALNICREARFKKVHFAASKRNAPLPGGARPPG